MLGAILTCLRSIASSLPFIGQYFTVEKVPVPNPALKTPLPAARVAIIGAGIGGCFSARFLKDLGGQNLDIHIWNKKESMVGGRTATIKLGDYTYEAGASVAHISNKHLVDAVEHYGLTMVKDDGETSPLGIYNGQQFVFRTGTSKILTVLKTLWHYGFSLFKMESSVKSLLKKFKRIYPLQESGQCYATVPDMLRAMDNGGDEVYNLTKISGQEHCTNLGWSDTVIDELVDGAMRTNYGQSTTVNAFCTFVSLAGMEDDSLWCVQGGNWQMAERALLDSGATLHKDEITAVARITSNGQVKYKLTTASGDDNGEFDVVIIANPLNVSDVQYIDFPIPVYTADSKTPYQRTVAEFVKGRVNKEFFGQPQSQREFPVTIITTELTGAPFEFRTNSVLAPSEAGQSEVKDYTRLYDEEPVRVWKIFTPKPLTQEQKREMFTEIEEEATVDWLAYPHYQPPDMCPPFVLDDGLFYINAIEKAASAMEMSAIGAKNVALLAREHLSKRQSSDN